MRIIYFRSLSYGVPIWVYFCFTLSREKYIDFNSFGSQKKIIVRVLRLRERDGERDGERDNDREGDRKGERGNKVGLN